jgi:hypothetical protein
MRRAANRVLLARNILSVLQQVRHAHAILGISPTAAHAKRVYLENTPQLSTMRAQTVMLAHTLVRQARPRPLPVRIVLMAHCLQ